MLKQSLDKRSPKSHLLPSPFRLVVCLCALVPSPSVVKADVGPDQTATEVGIPVEIDQPADAAREAAEPKAQTPVLGEIIVTARRTEENLQEVPIAINVLDEDALVERGIRNADDLAQASPGLSAIRVSGGTRGGSYSIRGQGEAFSGSNPGVVQYFAEVPDFSPFYYDLASVQVLKGPQGTLFGRNATGGALLLEPKKPSDEFSGYVRGVVGSYSRFDQEAGFGGPLLDGLSFRVAGQRLRRQGYTHDIRQDRRLDDEHRDSFRIALDYQPLDQLGNYLVFQRDRIAENGVGNVLTNFVDAPTTPNVDDLRSYVVLQEQRGPRKVEHDFADRLDYRQWGVINTTTWSINESLMLKNIFRFSKGGERVNAADGDGSPYRNLHVTIESAPNYSRSDELQLQLNDEDRGLHLVAGSFFLNFNTGVQPFSANLSAPGPAPVPLTLWGQMGGPSKSAAGFLQGTLTFWEDWSITAGFRRTFDRRAGDLGVGVEFPNGTRVPVAPVERFRTKAAANTWTLALNKAVTDDVMAYATVRRGYKSGGLTSPDVGGDPEKVTYKPEFVTSHEIGVKSEWEVGSVPLRLNLDGFYDDYTNIQRYSFRPSPELPANAVTNAAAAKIIGQEVDLWMLLSPSADLAVQYTHLHTKYDKFQDDAFGDLKATDFPNTPAHQITVRPAAHLILPDGWGTLTAQLPFYYQSKFASGVNNRLNGDRDNDIAVPGTRQKAFSRLDLRIDLRDTLIQGLGVGFYARNLTDETFAIGSTNAQSQAVIGVLSTVYAPPRMLGLELQYEF